MIRVLRDQTNQTPFFSFQASFAKDDREGFDDSKVFKRRRTTASPNKTAKGSEKKKGSS